MEKIYNSCLFKKEVLINCKYIFKQLNFYKFDSELNYKVKLTLKEQLKANKSDSLEKNKAFLDELVLFKEKFLSFDKDLIKNLIDITYGQSSDFLSLSNGKELNLIFTKASSKYFSSFTFHNKSKMFHFKSFYQTPLPNFYSKHIEEIIEKLKSKPKTNETENIMEIYLKLIN